jgi:hypothetical protein
MRNTNVCQRPRKLNPHPGLDELLSDLLYANLPVPDKENRCILQGSFPAARVWYTLRVLSDDNIALFPQLQEPGFP